MKPMKWLLTVCLVALLAACNLPGGLSPAPTEDITSTLDAVRTQAVQTAMAMEQNLATATQALPTPILLPTSTATQAAPTQQPADTQAAPTQAVPTATNTSVPATATTAPTATSASAVKPSISIVAVDKNRMVTIQTQDFPANQTFRIRVGPFVDFFRKYVEVGTISSGSGGSFKFNVTLPEAVRDVDRVTVRLDSSAGVYAFNVFTNSSSGSISTTATPATSAACQVSVSPTSSQTLKLKEDFDAVWTVKNTSGSDWDMAAVDYKYTSGTEMQKYLKLYDFTQTVKNGETIKIAVDMVAPDKAGTYTTTWSIVKGSTILCSLPLTVVVK